VAEAVLKKPVIVKDKYTHEEKTVHFWAIGNTKLFGKDDTPDVLIEWHRKQVAALVQSWWRYNSVYETQCQFYRSTCTIQKKWKDEMLRRKLEKMMPDIRRIQRTTMTTLALKKFNTLRKRRDATVRVQNFWRGVRLVRHIERRGFVLSVQKWYRALHLIRTTRIKSTSERVQTWYRARHLLNALRDRQLIITAQTFVQKWRIAREWAELRKKLESQKARQTLAIIQKRAKVVAARSKVVRIMKTLAIRWHSARTIQRTVRRYLTREHFKRTINAVNRAHQNLLKLRAEALTVMWLVRSRKAKARHRKQRSLEIVIQQYTNWRTRIWWRTLRLAAVCIQRYSRRFLAKLYTHRRRYVLVRAQASARMMLWMSRYLAKHRRVVKIQAWVRC
jgi:hypothetical protein